MVTMLLLQDKVIILSQIMVCFNYLGQNKQD
jgi:hypothetical protein